MTKVNAYLTFNGNCEEAFGFYKSVFGGEFLYMGRYKDVPPTDRQKFQLENDEKIMHVSLPIGKETILMGCDSTQADGQEIIFGDNISLSVNIDNKEEADRLFNELSVGGQIKMAMSQTFWGSYFGVFTDRFGINWLINCESNESN
jgi:PhnB protein